MRRQAHSLAPVPPYRTCAEAWRADWMSALALLNSRAARYRCPSGHRLFDGSFPRRIAMTSSSPALSSAYPALAYCERPACV